MLKKIKIVTLSMLLLLHSSTSFANFTTLQLDDYPIAYAVFATLLIPLFISTLWLSVLYIWLKVGTRKKLNPTIQNYPKIGLMVPHYNEPGKDLIAALESLELQDYPEQIYVVLADDGSSNDVQSHLQPWLNGEKNQHYTSVVYEQNNGSKGKNMDASLKYFPDDIDVLVVVDSDTILERQSVRKVVERMWRDDKTAAVCGFVVPVNSRDSYWKRVQYFEHIGIYPVVKSAQDVFGQVSIMAGAFVAHRVSVIKEIGGWGDWIVEDIAWTWKALASGYRTGYCPDAVAYTKNPEDKKSLFMQRRRWARGRVEAYKTAIKTSPARALLLGPLFVMYLASLLPPMLGLLPILAAVFGQWWVFAVIAGTGLLSAATFIEYQKLLPEHLRNRRRDFVKSAYYNTMFDIFLWRPNVLGFFDEVLGKRKSWLTRD